MVNRIILSCIVSLGLYPGICRAQDFYFQDTETTLIKTTDQSPAHWYIEIFSNLDEDKTLRWKTFFDHIPEEWSITFNDQTTNYFEVNDGDSADFILLSDQEFPQKLIIGAMLNNTPGNGTVSFEIYDPGTPASKDTIRFHFIISQGSLGMEETAFYGQFRLENDVISSVNGNRADFSVFDETGRELVRKEKVNALDVSGLLNGLFFIHIRQGNDQCFMKLSR